MATLPADRTKLALAQSNQNPQNVLGSSQNKNAITEAYDTIDLLYSNMTGLISAAQLSKLGIINVMDYNASGSAQTTTGSISTGTSILTLASSLDFKNGQGINVNGKTEVDNLQITASATVSSNVTVTLNGVAFTVAVLAGDTIAQVATKIRSATYTGWSTSGATDTIIFTSTTTGTRTTPVYSAGTTTAAGTMTVTTLGSADLFTSIVSGAGTTTLTLAVNAIITVSGTVTSHDDTSAIQAAINSLPTGTFGGGEVRLPSGTYLISSTISIPSGVRLVGSSPRSCRIVPSVNSISILTVSAGSSRWSIENLLLDGAGKTGITGLNLPGTGASAILHGSARNLWFDSMATGVSSTYLYFIKFDTCRFMSVTNGFILGTASNALTLINCALFCTSTGLTWNNSSGLAVSGCMFESNSPVWLYTCQGASFSGNYFENMGTAYAYHFRLGTGTGGSADGITIHGNQFNNGANFGVSLQACSGVEIEGNYFKTVLSAIEMYQSDTTPKRDIRIGQNTYNINSAGYDPTKIITYTGATFDSLNCNLNMEQVQPIVFDVQNEPQPSTINNNQSTLFWDGTNFIIKSKNNVGAVTKRTLSPIQNNGAVTFPSAASTLIIAHGLGATPKTFHIQANSSNTTNAWITSVDATNIYVSVPAALSANGFLYWDASL